MINLNHYTTIEDNKVFIKENISPKQREELKNYKSGGITKKGRGILDEYYTKEIIVKAMTRILEPKKIKALEPSAGIGNFMPLIYELDKQASINAFEINEVSARILKLLYPNVEVSTRSFETEFITENGGKKQFEKYNLIVGNPPYGNHRGYYKGLGEEPKISKYEDYFVKRSLDSLQEDGTLAMVLPSSWMNANRKANIKTAYRLPEGSFEGTKIGTDIVVINKSCELIQTRDYFNETNTLGELRERKNRFGRIEQYVFGDLEKQINKIK